MEPKIEQSNDKEWREYYENKCRAARKEIAALSDACMKALEVFQGKRYRAGVPELLFKTLVEWGYLYDADESEGMMIQAHLEQARDEIKRLAEQERAGRKPGEGE